MRKGSQPSGQKSMNLRLKVKFENLVSNETKWLVITDDMKTIRDIKSYLSKQYSICEPFECFLEDIVVNDLESTLILRDNEVLVLKAIYETTFESTLHLNPHLDNNECTARQTNEQMQKNKTFNVANGVESVVNSVDSVINSVVMNDEKNVIKKNNKRKTTNNAMTESLAQNDLSFQPFIELKRMGQNVNEFKTKDGKRQKNKKTR